MLNGPNPHVNMDTGTLPLEQHRKALGNDTYKLWSYETSMKLFEYQKRVGARIPPPFSGAHAPSVWRAIRTGSPYAVKALLCAGANPLLSGANIHGIDEALRKLDLLVVQDLYMTPTAELADYVTPAAPDDIENCRLYTGGPCTGWLEGHSLLSGERAVDPPGEARSDFEFFRELGVRLGQDWPWETDEAYYDWQLKPLGFASFREFHEKVQWSVQQPSYGKYEDRGFGTPSGKVEIYSSFLEELGYLGRVVDAAEVFDLIDGFFVSACDELHASPDIPGRVARCPEQGREQGRLVAVVPALLMKGFLGTLHAAPVPLGLDVIFDVFVD